VRLILLPPMSQPKLTFEQLILVHCVLNILD
jgi:hypothetical protein